MHIRGAWAWALLIVLFMSVGANLFLAGFLAERWRSGRAFGPPPMVQMMRDFPPEIRRAIARELWAERDQFRQAFDDIREKRRALLEAMRAPTLDEARLRSQLSEVRALTSRIQERAQDATIDALRRMSPEERALIGERRRWRGPPDGPYGNGGPMGHDRGWGGWGGRGGPPL
jgi:uncharacterized membrane protein